MSATAEVFESHRSRLFGIACRMLGSRSEAEDLLQDAYLRWHAAKSAEVQSVVAFLVTVTTRLCLDRLRKRKHELLQHSAEAWLVDAHVVDSMPSPEMLHECAEDASAALAAVFDRLDRQERAAFLLHEVFDYDYPELARMLRKAEPACRQMVHRARKRVRESRPHCTARTDSRRPLLAQLLGAVRSGDRRAALPLIEADLGYCDN